MVNWLRQQADRQVCYHFFDRDYDTHSYDEALSSIAEQLLRVHGIEGHLTGDAGLSKAIIHDVLAQPHEGVLLVLLDGIDQAYSTLQPNRNPFQNRGLFPRVLGRNVTVVLSLRDTETEEDLPRMLREWLGIDTLHHFPIPLFDDGAARELIRRSPRESIRIRADDRAFVASLRSKTGGLPIFVTYLIDELAYHDDLTACLGNTPAGFADFVQQCAEAALFFPAWNDAFAFLALMLGPASERDLVSLTALSGHPLGAIEFVAVPWQVRRWLRHNVLTGAWSFQHTTIADAFAAKYVLSNSVPYRDLLLRYCRAEAERPAGEVSRYALEHLCEHLGQLGAYDEIFALAGNQQFLLKQAALSEVNPVLPLETVRSALSAALERKDAALTARFVIQHSTVFATLRESPLKSLRAGNLGRAKRLVSTYPQAFEVIWHLLMAWELFDAGSPLAARELLAAALRGLPGLSSADHQELILL